MLAPRGSPGHQGGDECQRLAYNQSLTMPRDGSNNVLVTQPNLYLPAVWCSGGSVRLEMTTGRHHVGLLSRISVMLLNQQRIARCIPTAPPCCLQECCTSMHWVTTLFAEAVLSRAENPFV